MDKTENINVRVSEKVKVQILLRAAELGMKISDYIRYLITKDIEESRK